MIAARAGMLVAAAIVAGAAPCLAGDGRGKSSRLPGLVAGRRVAVETIHFANPNQAPVQLLRGIPGERPNRQRHAVQHPHRRLRIQPPRHPQSTQIVSFGTGFADRVMVVRGGAGIPARLAHRPDSAARAAGVFVAPQQAGVAVLRGNAIRELFSLNLFGAADRNELDRIAFAVDGIESRHGADPGMWRPLLNGPQGPMQVSAAAATDVGGGNRFDLAQNRQLGRAYLAQMYRRYGNWPDALAAYNWGPANVDQWIAGGRDVNRLPLDVARYVALVLRDALVTARQ